MGGGGSVSPPNPKKRLSYAEHAAPCTLDVLSRHLGGFESCGVDEARLYVELVNAINLHNDNVSAKRIGLVCTLDEVSVSCELLLDVIDLAKVGSDEKA